MQKSACILFYGVCKGCAENHRFIEMFFSFYYETLSYERISRVCYEFYMKLTMNDVRFSFGKPRCKSSIVNIGFQSKPNGAGFRF